MPSDEAKLIVKLEADSRRMQSELDRANKKLTRFEQQTKKSLSAVSSSFKKLIGGIALVALTRQVIKYGDEWTNLSNRLKLVTRSNDELAAAQANVFRIAQDTRQSVSATAELYQRLALSTRDLGIEQSRLNTITETINKTLVLSGASSQAAQAAIVQLGQGLAAGALRGEEFNSVAEQAPRLMQVFADSLGVGIGELRNMAKAGQLTAQTVIEAIEKQAAAIDKEFAKTSTTVEQAMLRIDNALLQLVGGAAQTSGATDELADALSNLAKILEDPETIKTAHDLASAIVSIASASIKGASALGFLIDEIKAFAFGAEIGDLVRLNDELGKLEEKRAKRALGTPYPNVAQDPLIQRLDAEIARTRQLIDLSENLVLIRQAGDRTAKLPLDEEVGGLSKTGSTSIDDLFIRKKKRISEEEKQLQKLADSLRGDIATAQDEYNQRLADANRLLDAGEISQQEYNKAVTQYREELQAATPAIDSLVELEQALTDSLTPQAKALRDVRAKMLMLNLAMDDFPGKADEIIQAMIRLQAEEKEILEGDADELSKFAERAAENMQDAFADFLFDPFDEGLDGMVRNFARALQRMLAEAAAAQVFDFFNVERLLSGGLSGSVGGGILGGLLGIGGSGGGIESQIDAALSAGNLFAGGGFPPVGEPSIVGENGPELFIPKSAGMIVPNYQINNEPTPVQVAVVYDTQSVLEIMRTPAARRVMVENTRKDASEISRNLSKAR